MRKVLLFALLCVSLAKPVCVNAQKAFTPISRSGYSNGIIGNYFDSNSFAFVNFMMSYSLIIQPFEALSIRMSTDNRSGIITVRTKTEEYRMECSPELYASLILLTKHAVNTASFTMDRGGLDGARYYLFLNDNGVTGFSSEGLTGMAVKVFEHIGTTVMAGDRERLESFTAIADYMYHAFKVNYHESMLRTDYGLSRTWPENVYTLSLSADLGSDMYKMMTYQQYCDIGGFRVQFKSENRDFQDQDRAYYEKYENLLRRVGYWVYVQSDFADDSNHATFTVDESVSAPVVKETAPCEFEIRLKESDLTADKMISLLEGVHKKRKIHFMAGDVVNPVGSTSITYDEVSARLNESVFDILQPSVPQPVK